jgi:O-methyltransferase
MADSKQLYLDLMKKTLVFYLWPEPPHPIEATFFRRSFLTRFLLMTISKFLAHFRLRLMLIRNFTQEQRQEGLVWPGYADTMIGLKRLDNLQFCVETVIKENIPGDFIETGVWRGGACIFMKAILVASGIKDRKVFVADSFQGLPKPDENKYIMDKGDKHHTFYSALAVSQEEVKKNFEKYGLLDNQVIFLKGWFKDTLPIAPIEQLSILRLDGDMYSSTIEVLETLYPKLSKGGFCIIDDYALSGCRQAVDDYRSKNGITNPLEIVDLSGRWWRKD